MDDTAKRIKLSRYFWNATLPILEKKKIDCITRYCEEKSISDEANRLFDPNGGVA
jgi:hypothetical protein